MAIKNIKSIDLLQNLQSQISSLKSSDEDHYTTESSRIREFLHTIYQLINQFIPANKSLNHAYKHIFEANQEKPSIKFINSRPHLQNILEKTFMWLLLEIFYCRSFVSSMKTLLFSQENDENLNKFYLILTDFIENKQISLHKSSFFAQFEIFLQKYENNEALQKLDSLKEEWKILKKKSEEPSTNNPSVIISKTPITLNLSENSNPASEENSPQPIKDSLGFSCFEEETNSKRPSKKINKSQQIYRDLYKKVNEQFKFRTEEGEFRLRDQFQKCWKCKTSISKGLFSFGGNARYCHYYNRWFCKICISAEKSVIPQKILRDFDFGLYEICKDGMQEIKEFLTKPIIKIAYENEIVLKNKELYETLIIRRQLHLIFETICNTDLLKILLESNLNLILRENLFSLQNILDIYKGTLKHELLKINKVLIEHFSNCEACAKKASICSICKSTKPIYFFEIKHTKVCKTCKRVFHFKCYNSKGCEDCGILSLLNQI